MLVLWIVLIVFLASHAWSFRLIPHFAQTSHSRTVLQAFKSFTQSPESYQTISTINHCSVSLAAIGSLIQRWGAEQAAIGTSIICENIDNGICFHFEAAKDSELQLLADCKEDKTAIELKMFFDIASTDQRIGSLVQMMGDSLVHALVNEVSLRVVEDPAALEAALHSPPPPFIKSTDKQLLNPKTDLELIQQLDADSVDIKDADFLHNIDLNLTWQEKTETDNTLAAQQEEMEKMEQTRMRTTRKLREQQMQQMIAKKQKLSPPPPPPSTTSKPFIPTSREFLPDDPNPLTPPKKVAKVVEISRNIPIFSFTNLPPLSPSGVHYRLNYVINFIQDLCKSFVKFHNLEPRHEISLLSITETTGSRFLLSPKLEFLDPKLQENEDNLEEISLLIRAKKVGLQELTVEGWIDSDQAVDMALRQTMEKMIVEKLQPLLAELDVAGLDIFDEDSEEDEGNDVNQAQQQVTKSVKKQDDKKKNNNYGFEVIKPVIKPTPPPPSAVAPFAAAASVPMTNTPSSPQQQQQQQQPIAPVASSSATTTTATTTVATNQLTKPVSLLSIDYNLEDDDEELIPMTNSNDEFIQSRNFILQQQQQAKRTSPTTAATKTMDFQEFDDKLSEQQKSVFLQEANEQLQEMLKNSRRDGSGFYTVLQTLAAEDADGDKENEEEAEAAAAAGIGFELPVADGSVDSSELGNRVESEAHVMSSSNSKQEQLPPAATKKLSSLFQAGRDLSQLNLQALLDRPSSDDYQQTLDQLRSSTLPTFPVELTSLHSTDEEEESVAEEETEEIRPRHFSSQQQQTADNTQPAFTTAINEDDEFKLYMLLQELRTTSPDLHPMILDGFRDLLLSDSFLPMVQRVTASVSSSDREKALYTRMVEKALLLHKEVEVLASEESVRHLDTIYQICTIAIDFQQDEMKFLDQMDELRDRFDADLLLYIHHAIDQEQQDLLFQQQEEGKEQAEDGQEPTSVWLQVLTVMKQGVTAELQTRFEDLFEPLSILIRIDDTDLRRLLFERFVNVTSTSDLAHMRQLAINMADVTLAQESPDVIKMVEEFPQLLDTMILFRQEIDEFLSDDVIESRFEDLQAEAAEQDLEVVIRHRNPIVRRRMIQKDKEAKQALKRSGMSLAGGLMMGGINPTKRKLSSDDDAQQGGKGDVHNTKALTDSSSLDEEE